uniref:Adenosine deaminase n=2 Tax=Clastoptera arizonana TaxID=38151 RepID=A0A1B6E8G2_9HEMI
MQPEDGFVEEAPVTEDLLRIFKEASQTKVHRTIHAGEASGASAIERAVYKLGAERVGHGYHVVRDEKLFSKCLEDDVHFECCPYSSILTGAVKEGGPTHPIIRFAEDNANFSLNSDDPTLTGHSLEHDYNLVRTWGMQDYHFAAANINAAKSSFLPDGEKETLVKMISQSYGKENS